MNEPTTVSENGTNYEIINVDPRDKTSFVTGDGVVNVIHEFTLGDVLITTSLLALLIFLVVSIFVKGKG